MFSFILTAVGVSLSGVLAPGPMTTAAFAAGSRDRHAGLALGLGHVCVELPLMLLLVAGAGAFFKINGVQAAIGLAGGLFLLFMGGQLLASLRKSESTTPETSQRHPFLTGIVLTCANPYFLLWWATVGITIATQAMDFGVAALAIFAILHWGCDIGWLQILSTAGYKGTQALGQRSQTIINAICGMALIFFGLRFLHGAAVQLDLL